MGGLGQESALYKELVKHTAQAISADEARGRIYMPKIRWDQKDQDAFDKIPVEVLLDDPYYGGGRYQYDELEEISGGGGGGLWPEHRQDIIDLQAARERDGVDTFIAIEGIGSGKTHKFRNVLRLDVMKVLTRVNPLPYYGLDPEGQGIAFVCMSRTASLAKQVTFNTILKAFNCPFFREIFPPKIDFDKVEEMQIYPSILKFPKDVVIFPGTGSASSTIGYNLFGGGIDEANYLEVVGDSKKAVVGGEYDAAEAMYTAIKSRMKSRFVSYMKKHDRLPGLLMMFSNTRHRTDFLERMAIKAQTDKTIFFRRRTSWEGQPKEWFCGETFNYDVVNNRIVDDSGTPIFEPETTSGGF